MLAVENKTCKIQLPSGLTNFRIITVKSYLHKYLSSQTSALYDSYDLKSDLVQLAKKDINDDNEKNINAAKLPCQNLACTHRLPTRFQHIANISIFLKNQASKPSFTNSEQKEINSFSEKDTFKVILISDVSNRMRIFHSYFVDEIKNERTATVFEKSRLILQVYDNNDKKKILT